MQYQKVGEGAEGSDCCPQRSGLHGGAELHQGAEMACESSSGGVTPRYAPSSSAHNDGERDAALPPPQQPGGVGHAFD